MTQPTPQTSVSSEVLKLNLDGLSRPPALPGDEVRNLTWLKENARNVEHASVVWVQLDHKEDKRYLGFRRNRIMDEHQHYGGVHFTVLTNEGVPIDYIDLTRITNHAPNLEKYCHNTLEWLDNNKPFALSNV